MKTPTRKLLPTVKSTDSSTAPFRISSILVPIDFSTASKKALTYAAALAEQFGARLTLIFAIEPLRAPDFMLSLPLMMEQDETAALCKSRLTKFARKNSIKPTLIEKALIRHGRPFVEITEAA